MCKKLTKEEFLKRIQNVSANTISVLNNEYYNTQAEYMFKCKVCGYEWKTKGYSVLQGHGCRKCYDKRNAENKLFSIEKVQKRVDESGSQTEIIGNYIDTKHKCDGRCCICGHIWRPNVSEIMRGHGCPKCGLNKLGLKRRVSPNEYKERCRTLYGDLYDLSELNYTIMREKVYPICSIHGKVAVNADSFIVGNGCPLCSRSKLEIEIFTFLKEKNIQFIDQANRKNLKWLGLQTLDFYLPEYGVGIECQGLQHFKSIDLFGGEEYYQDNIRRDKLKLQKCQENNVKLLYYSNLGIDYPYKVFENKDDLLNEIKKNDLGN